MKPWNKNWFAVKINRDYFSLSGRWGNLQYFLNQWYVFSHLIDRFKWRSSARFFHVFNFPSHIDIEASSKCQMRCPMCGTHLMKARGIKDGHMDFELYKGIIDECARKKVYSVKLSWRGECLLNPNIVRMVKYAKDKGIKDVAFLTNGERLNPDLTSQLVEAGLDWISFSIDGLGETYEKIRWPETFKGITSKVKFLKDYRDSRGKKKPLIRIQSIWSAIKKNPEKFRNFWSPMADRINFIADETRSSEQKDFTHDPNYICPQPWQRMCVTWDGKVSLCCEDYLERSFVGDVEEQSLYEIWWGEAANKLRYLMKNKQRLQIEACKTCCDGGITKEEVVQVGNRIIKMNVYLGQQLDLASMDARPKMKK